MYLKLGGHSWADSELSSLGKKKQIFFKQATRMIIVKAYKHDLANRVLFSGGVFSRFGFLRGSCCCCCLRIGLLGLDASSCGEELKRSSCEGPLSPSNEGLNFFVFGEENWLLFTFPPADTDKSILIKFSTSYNYWCLIFWLVHWILHMASVPSLAHLQYGEHV